MSDQSQTHAQPCRASELLMTFMGIAYAGMLVGVFVGWSIWGH